MSIECDICVDNVKENNIIICNKCKCKICKNCIRTYLLDNANVVPKCPNCEVGLTIDQIQNYLGATKFSKFLQNATKNSLSIEKQRISEIMDDVESYLKNNYVNELIKKINKRYECKDKDLITKYKKISIVDYFYLIFNEEKINEISKVFDKIDVHELCNYFYKIYHDDYKEYNDYRNRLKNHINNYNEKKIDFNLNYLRTLNNHINSWIKSMSNNINFINNGINKNLPKYNYSNKYSPFHAVYSCITFKYAINIIKEYKDFIMDYYSKTNNDKDVLQLKKIYEDVLINNNSNYNDSKYNIKNNYKIFLLKDNLNMDIYFANYYENNDFYIYCEEIKRKKIKPKKKLLRKINIDNNVGIDNNIDIDVVDENDYGIDDTKPIAESKYILPCPSEDCRGLITSRWKCKLCGKKYCNKCLADITDNNDNTNDNNKKIHICKQEDIDNLSFILSTTKPCPNCATRIFRSDGCPQMFCTHCHTSFNYNTGKLITSNFHNPHRAEWLRNNSNNIEEVVECGIGITENNFRDCELLISLIYRRNHITQFLDETYIYRLNRIRDESKNGVLYKLRFSYVTNEITEKQYYNSLRRIETKKHKYNQYIPLYKTYIDTISDYLVLIRNEYIKLPTYKLRNNASENPLIKEYLNQIDKLAEYINNELNKISTVFSNCMYYKINSVFDYKNYTFTEKVIKNNKSKSKSN